MSTERAGAILVLLAVALPATWQAAAGDADRITGPPAAEADAGDRLQLAEDADADGEAESQASYLSMSITLGSARESGLRAEGAEIDDTVHTVSPAIRAAKRGPRNELLFGYEPEVQMFDEHEELDSVEHKAGALFRRDLSRRSGWVLGGSYLAGEDPGRHLGGALVVQPRIPYEERRVYTALEHRLRHTTWILHLGRTTTEVESESGLFAADQTDDAATVAVSRELSRRTGIHASYSYLDPAVEEREGAVRAATFIEPFQTLTVGLGLQPGARVTVHLTAGVLYGESAAGAGDEKEARPLAAIDVARAGETLSFRFRYDRSPLSLTLGGDPVAPGPLPPTPGTALLRDAESDVVSLRFSARLSSRLRWEQLLWGSRTTLAGADPLEARAATARLVARLSRHRLGAFAQVEHLEQDGSPLIGPRFERTRVGIGLIVGLSGYEGAWGIRDDDPILPAVLPHRRGE